MRSSKPILLIEDDNADLLIIKRALKELDINNELMTANNGEEGLELLRADTTQKPCIILLDLNMPKMNGLEFLKIVKEDDDLKEIPVIALTTSQNSHDIRECFRLGIAGYIVKPIDYRKFVKAVRIMDLYWMICQMPNEIRTEEVLEKIEIDDLRENQDI